VDVAPIVALAVLAVAAVAGNLLFPPREARIERELAAEPRALIAEAQDTVRLVGRVRRVDELLQAPLSGRPCVAYALLVDQAVTAGSQGMSNWRRRVEIQQARPFIVADETGEARVDTSGPVRMALVYDRSGATSWLREYPGKYRELSLCLESAGIGATNWLGRWKGFRYGEGVIEEGQVVTVGGSSAREVDPGGIRPGPRSMPELLVLRGSEASPLLISGERVES